MFSVFTLSVCTCNKLKFLSILGMCVCLYIYMYVCNLDIYFSTCFELHDHLWEAYMSDKPTYNNVKIYNTS
jgi:hypothetical protein